MSPCARYLSMVHQGIEGQTEYLSACLFLGLAFGALLIAIVTLEFTSQRKGA